MLSITGDGVAEICVFLFLPKSKNWRFEEKMVDNVRK